MIGADRRMPHPLFKYWHGEEIITLSVTHNILGTVSEWLS